MVPKKGFLNMVYRFCIIKTGKVFETLLNLGFSEYSQKNILECSVKTYSETLNNEYIERIYQMSS